MLGSVKAAVEGTVGIISTFILAALRNRQFLSLLELNEAIWGRLEMFNHKPFQKREGSRASSFAEERPFLRPLPPRPFELAIEGGNGGTQLPHFCGAYELFCSL